MSSMTKPAGKAKGSLASGENSTRADFLLDVAAQSFLKLGFEGTSVGAIARRAHASKETFYSTFKTKDDLFRAVMRRVMDRFSAQLQSILAVEDAPEKALMAFGSVMLERVLSDDGIGLQRIVVMESGRFPELAQIFFELGPKRTLGALVQYFNAQVLLLRLRKMDSEIAAGHFMGLLASDLIMRKSLGVLSPLPPREKKKRVKAAVDVFLRAYGPEHSEE
jgi:TetR/AcrR family transcriptional repressor of mexJK operon